MSALQNENGGPGKVRGGAKHRMDLNCRCMKRKFLARIRSFYEHAQASCRRLAGTDPGEPTPFCRWWPALMAGGGVAFCALILALQQMELRELKEDIQALHATLSGQNNAAKTELFGNGRFGQAANASPKAYEQEIERLKEQAARITGELEEIERLRIENASMRKELAAPPPNLPPEFQAMEGARQRALSRACISNLKQVGMAAILWAIEARVLPPDLRSIQGDLASPRILVCPDDPGRQPAENWAAFTPSHSSYEYLAGSGGEREPTRVMTRCPVHGHVGLWDGSVRRISNPEPLIQRDGKLYLQDDPRR
jgi:hypothetical protein